MDVGFCPECKKAGLRHEDNDGLGYDGKTAQQRYTEWNNGVRMSLAFNFYRWCPRCQKWVEPILKNVMNK